MRLDDALAWIGIACLVVGVAWEIAAERRRRRDNTPTKHNPNRSA